MEAKKTLREIRESRGVSRKHICDVLGITRQSLINKESGKTKYSALEVQKLCDEFNIPITDIFLAK